MTPLWIASDWHLSPRSPPAHARLAEAFLELAAAAGVRMILNGDVWDDLFDGPGAGARALPGVARAIDGLAAAGRLERTRGNHDPDAGPARLVLEVPGLGRVLVAHGHEADPVNASPVGRLGDAISRRFGRLAAVRGAAALAEAAARALAGERLVSLFRARCLDVVRGGGFDLGVFGHVHVAHAAPGDAYANAGALSDAGLSYLVLDERGARVALLRADDVGGASRGAMG